MPPKAYGLMITVSQSPLVEQDTEMEGQAVPQGNGGHAHLMDMPVSCAPMTPDADRYNTTQEEMEERME